MDTDVSTKRALRTILEAIGEDPDREGLQGTPERIIKAWGEIFAGYHTNPADVLKLFPNESKGVGLIWVEDIPFYSMCEHHMLPFAGTATVAYLPLLARVIGLSKIPRAVRLCAQRMTLQEALTEKIADVIGSVSRGAGVAVRSQHLCLAMRGVEIRESTMATTAVTGNLETGRWHDEFHRRINA